MLFLYLDSVMVFYADRDIDLSTSEKTHKFVDIRYKLKVDLL